MEKLSTKEQIVLQKIREFITQGQKLTIRALQSALGYASPRSISVMLDQLIMKWWVYRDSRDQICISPSFQADSTAVRNIPLIGAIACGMPIFADENIETEIPVSTKIVSGDKKYFFLRAEGDSMDKKGIESGDLVLIEQTQIAENGKVVVALINDEATLKELQVRDESIFLIPHSYNPKYRPIILDNSDDTFSIQWVFVRSFPGWLFA
jgi:SOS regulatory protein LexA